MVPAITDSLLLLYSYNTAGCRAVQYGSDQAAEAHAVLAWQAFAANKQTQTSNLLAYRCAAFLNIEPAELNIEPLRSTLSVLRRAAGE